MRKRQAVRFAGPRKPRPAPEILGWEHRHDSDSAAQRFVVMEFSTLSLFLEVQHSLPCTLLLFSCAIGANRLDLDDVIVRHALGRLTKLGARAALHHSRVYSSATAPASNYCSLLSLFYILQPPGNPSD